MAAKVAIKTTRGNELRETLIEAAREISPEEEEDSATNPLTGVIIRSKRNSHPTALHHQIVIGCHQPKASATSDSGTSVISLPILATIRPYFPR